MAAKPEKWLAPACSLEFQQIRYCQSWIGKKPSKYYAKQLCTDAPDEAMRALILKKERKDVLKIDKLLLGSRSVLMMVLSRELLIHFIRKNAWGNSDQMF